MPPSHPEVEIASRHIRARIYLPDPERGFYRSTRFDWSGMVGALEYRGHQFYGPWFARTAPGVRDFVDDGREIVAGAESAATGPAEEFRPAPGFDAAAPGHTFLKIGVGVLRRPDAVEYSPFATYALVDPGTWSVEAGSNFVSWSQRVDDPTSGLGYAYRKTLRLDADRPALIVDHVLQNTGRHPLVVTQYSHNFLVLDGEPVGSDIAMTVPFPIQTSTPPDPSLATIDGNRVAYVRRLVGRDRVTFPIEGFGPKAADYDVTVENTRTGAGVRVTSDRPLVRMLLWSIRSVVAVEPFVDVSTAPGATTSWRYRYEYFA